MVNDFLKSKKSCVHFRISTLKAASAFPSALVTRECEVRQNNRIARLLRESKLPLEKSLKAFDRKRLPRKVDAQLDLLLKGDFLDHKENVLAFGFPGSGKTHLLCAIAQELTHHGRQVRFTSFSLHVAGKFTLAGAGGSVEAESAVRPAC